jgi:hypothetical protein
MSSRAGSIFIISRNWVWLSLGVLHYGGIAILTMRPAGRIRPDVREAGHKVWNSVCLKAEHILGDANDAPELLERAVKTISRYLDKHQALPYSIDPAGLLVLAFHRSLYRLASRRNRITLLGDGIAVAEMLRAPDWRQEIDHHLFLEELARELSNESRLILRLRIIGYDWKEIARMLGTRPPALRQRFWRDLRRAHLTLLRAKKLKSFAD